MNIFKKCIFIFLFSFLFGASYSYSQDSDFFGDGDDSSFSDSGSGESAGYNEGVDSSFGGDSSDKSDSFSPSLPVKKRRKYNVLDDYSFKKFYHREKKILLRVIRGKKIYKHRRKKPRKWFAFAINYDTKYQDYFRKYMNPDIYKKPTRQADVVARGWGFNTEFIATKWLSLFLGYSDNYRRKEVYNVREVDHYNSFYFGTRIYFSFLYLGAGGVLNSWHMYKHSRGGGMEPPWTKRFHTKYLSAYVQVGANLAVMKNLAVTVGVNIQPSANKKHQKHFVSEGDFYVGLRYSV